SACGAFQVSSSVIQFNFIYIAPKHLSQSLNASVTASYTEIKPHLHSLFLAHTTTKQNHIHTHTHSHTQHHKQHTTAHTITQAHTHTCIHTHTHVHTCIHTHTHTC